MKATFFTSHLTALMLVTILCGLVYVTVQQAHRSGANDPQLQIALDMKNAIDNNRSFGRWMTDDSIEISQSLSVFTALYDKDGNAISSTGLLDGQLPKIPHGVFQFTNQHAEDVFTWQPRVRVRMAMVLEAVNSPRIGFVAVGRSLNEIEKRESNLTTMVLVAWLVCAGLILLHLLFAYFNNKQNK